MSSADRIGHLLARAQRQLAALRQRAVPGQDAGASRAALDELAATLAALGGAAQPVAAVAQRRERVAALAAIAGELAHDLGNPLAGISMQAQLILHRIECDDHQSISHAAPAAQRVLAEIDRLNGLVMRLADFAHRQHADFQLVDVAEFLRAVAAPWHERASARAITISVEVAPGTPPLRADAEQLRRALDHLLKNALEAMDEPGRIDVRVTLPMPDTITITISDTGPGIPPTVRPFHLFESTKPDRLGVGLAIARQIVVAHGGNIECAPGNPHGTVVSIELPRQRPV